ncbi:MAG TPA: apolipoprotein N-acyltransferase [Acidimicrobiales bacterium]|nr:apolipoprotein N-acyltransferase [Acidimicrobiales bacterium]
MSRRATRGAPGPATGGPRPRARARRAGRSVVAALVPLAAGACVAASVPPGHAYVLAPVGVALLAHANAGRPAGRRFAHGATAGIAQFAFGLHWALQFTAFGYVALVVVEAAFVAVACAVAPGGRGRVAGLAAALVLGEWARSSWPFGGMPIGGVALGQAGGPLVALARVGGPALVVAAVALAGTAMEATGTAVARAARERDTRRLVAGVGPAIALVAVAASAVLGAHAPDGGPVRGRLAVAAVQGGGRRGLSELDVPAADVLAAQLAATSRLRPGAALVVWPEDSLSLAGPLRRSSAATLLGTVARRLDATLVAGVTEPAGPRHFRNEVVAWSPSGRIVGTFEKVHPVPFGEYVPFRAELSHLVSLAAVPRDAVPGHGTGELSTPAARLALLVSYETFFTGRGRSGVRAGGELVVVPTNTASYASDAIPAQELAASRLQAVATGRDLVQAASTGYSAIVDRRGAVVRRSALGHPAIVLGTVELFDGLTCYDRFGDLPVLALAAAALVASRAAGLARPRVRRPARRSA